MKNMLVIISLFISFTATSALAKPETSHSIEELKALFSDKVYVLKTPLVEGREKISHAIFLQKNGENFQCIFDIDKSTKKTRWYTNPIGRKNGTWKLTKQLFSSGVLFTTNGNNSRSIPVYNEKTKVLERWYKRKSEWKMLQVGHLQDTWPAWALEKCPDLVLPEGLKVNQAQTTNNYSKNYEAVMGKPFPELSLNKPLWLATPLKANGTEVIVSDVMAKLEETSDRMKLVSEGQTGHWLTYNPVWKSVWISSSPEDVKHYGYLESDENSLWINWQNNDLSITREDLFLSDIWKTVNNPTGHKHEIRKLVEWLTENPYQRQGGPKVYHHSDGTVTIKYDDNSEETQTWEFKGEMYVAYDNEQTPKTYVDYREIITFFGDLYN